MLTYNKCPCGAEIATTEELCETCKLRFKLDKVNFENRRLRKADSLIRKLVSARDANSSVLGEAVILEMRDYLAGLKEG